MKKNLIKAHVYIRKYSIVLVLLVIGVLCLVFPQILSSSHDIVVWILDQLNKYSSGLTALAALVALIFGASGIDAWKKKLKGKSDFDIARKYLRAVLKLRDSLKFVRNPFIPLGEMQEALKENGFDSDDFKDREKVNRAVYSSRWSKVQEVWTDLEAILIEAEISWGNQAVAVEKDLDKLVRELKGAIWFFLNSGENINPNDRKHKLIYGSYDDNDEFSKEVDCGIDKVRNFLKKYL
ncbi:MAG: hypothetical protein U0519_01045 [Candidatus Gracilibacteria bacterium]